MKKILPFLIMCSACVTPGLAQTKTASPELGSLVDAERAFSRASAAKGIRDAFLEYLADDAIIFRPHPLEARKWYLERPATSGVLTWEPIFAEVSRGGDLGYTTGPWEFRQGDANQQPNAYGHYVSVWRKQPNGLWRVVIDLGTVHPRPATKPAGVISPASDYPAKAEDMRKVEVEAERAALLEVDRAFSKASASEGAIVAFGSYSSDDIRFYRMNTFPVTGKEAVRAALSAKAGLLTWQPTAAEVSRSGDLGYTYGTAEFRRSGADKVRAESSSYVRIWRKGPQGKWMVALDITIPISPPTTKSEQ